MVSLADIVLHHPDGRSQPLSAYAGHPVILQTLRYFG